MPETDPPVDDTTAARVEEEPSPPPPPTVPVEPRRDRLRRHGRRARLYAWSVLLVALMVLVIALAVENSRQVRLRWLVGTSHASLVWVIVGSVILGWLLGIVTSIIFRLRTRRRRST